MRRTITLALLPHMTNDRASRLRNFDGSIAGVVIENVNGCVRKRGTEIQNDRGNGNFFIKTGDKHCYPNGQTITF